MRPAIVDALVTLLVHRLANRASPSSVVDWAVDALVAGEDTPSLVMLAGLERHSSIFETAPLLDKAIGECRA